LTSPDGILGSYSVRRFFVRDPDGKVVNVVSHR
jgi:hypothetical protein